MMSRWVAAVLTVALGVAWGHEGPVYDYPVTVDDVTVNANVQSVICEADGSQTTVMRRKVTVNTQRGAEGLAAPGVSWREGTASAWLLEVTVRRDGVTVFHLGPRPDGPELQLHPIDDGIGPMRRAEPPLPELEAGDQIEWAVELRRGPIIRRQVFAQMNWSLEFPVERGHFSVEAPRELELQARSWGPASEALVVPEGDRVRWTWRVDEVIEPIAPAPGEVLPRTIVSSAPSWRAIGRWYRQRITEAGGELGDGGAELVASVAELAHEDRVGGIFSRVRSCLALPHAAPWADAFSARAPAQVLESGIGDCKDRAWLIFRALEEAGLTPHLAVTGLSRGMPPLREQPPNPLLFDHVLVGVSVPGG